MLVLLACNDLQSNLVITKLHLTWIELHYISRNLLQMYILEAALKAKLFFIYILLWLIICLIIMLICYIKAWLYMLILLLDFYLVKHITPHVCTVTIILMSLESVCYATAVRVSAFILHYVYVWLFVFGWNPILPISFTPNVFQENWVKDLSPNCSAPYRPVFFMLHTVRTAHTLLLPDLETTVASFWFKWAPVMCSFHTLCAAPWTVYSSHL